MFRTLLLLTAALSLTACNPGRGGSGGSGDDDDNGPDGLGGLDTDGDGVLTADDLPAGAAGVYLTTTGGEDDGDEGDSVTDASLTSGDGAWGLQLSSIGGMALDLTLWFNDPVMDTYELDEGEGDLVSVNASAEGILVWASERSGTVTITAADETMASGYFEGSIELTVADQTETPTGEIITITGFAFHDVPYADAM